MLCSSYGFHTSHCLEALTLQDGDTGLALELLMSVYFSLELPPQLESSAEPLSEALQDARFEEKEALQAIYDNGFTERIPNKVWVVKLELLYLHTICDKPESKKVQKPQKELCKFFLKGNCKYSYKCKNSHDGSLLNKKIDDTHLKVPGEDSKEFELEIRFPIGSKYPSEPALVCVTAVNPRYPTDVCLKLTQRLQKEAFSLAQDGFPAVFSLVGILENENEIKEVLKYVRPGPKSSRSLIPSDEPEDETTSTAVEEKIQTSVSSGPFQRQMRQISSSEVVKENERLRKRFKDKFQLNEYQRMQRTRKNLPAWDYREKILAALAGHQVVVVSGATGCGKSTQVPQYLLDEWLGSDRWDNTSHREIICTQPRRLSAIGVAERVADERAEKIGQSVGYQIRLESKMSNSTRLMFCTTGILLRRLEGDSSLASVTHVIVDEVHERSEESDFLLMILRDLLPSRPDLKIILMSATLNAELFSEYFGGVPVLEIPGRTFPVEQFFLEDVLEQTEFAMEENSPYARHLKTNNNLGLKRGIFDSLDDAADDIDLEVALAGDNFKPAHDKTPDEKLAIAQLFHRYQGYNKKTCKALALMDPEKINYDLIESTLMWIVNGDHDYPRTGSILIFLPGMAEITTLHDQLRDHQLGQRRGDFLLVPLHSALSSDEQSLVFKKPKPGVRKIVISTNIAETSITIDDCVFVIDAGKMKEKRYDPNKNMESLELCWVSQANALQRRGRAGRVMPGVCIHLFTKHRFEWQFMKQPIPELQRVPLEQLVLRIKVLKLFEGREPWEVLSCTLEPPSDESVSTAICRLQDVGALDDIGALTPLGHHLAALPVDVRIGKLMLMGAIFCCVDSALTMAACLSYKSPFVSPFSKREEADAVRQQFACANSDQLTTLKAYKAWLKAREHSSVAGHAFAQENFLSSRTLNTIVETKQQLLELLASIGFVPGADFEPGRLRRAAKMGRDQILLATGTRLNSNNENTKLLASILCAALYPNVVKVLSPQKSFSQKAGGAVPRVPKPEELRFKTKEDGYVAIHPSSINYQVCYFVAALFSGIKFNFCSFKV